VRALQVRKERLPYWIGIGTDDDAQRAKKKGVHSST
jgi:hypothetical protein